MAEQAPQQRRGQADRAGARERPGPKDRGTHGHATHAGAPGGLLSWRRATGVSDPGRAGAGARGVNPSMKRIAANQLHTFV
ncbi:hypothetical protein VARIO8X_50599 [Burkholderiales bacterium 8X]|nr:hypothetical protein VARIO8X_50599 [Burkholderiales bacterium 8X]